MTPHCSQTAGIEKGLEGGKFLSECLGQAHSTQGVSLLTLSQTFMLQHQADLDDLQFTVCMCHDLFVIQTGNDSVKLTLVSS